MVIQVDLQVAFDDIVQRLGTSLESVTRLVDDNDVLRSSSDDQLKSVSSESGAQRSASMHLPDVKANGSKSSRKTVTAEDLKKKRELWNNIKKGIDGRQRRKSIEIDKFASMVQQAKAAGAEKALARRQRQVHSHFNEFAIERMAPQDVASKVYTVSQGVQTRCYFESSTGLHYLWKSG